MRISVSALGAQAAGSTSPRDTRKYRRKLASADATVIWPMRQPRSRVSQDRRRESRASFLSIRISIVRQMARETPTVPLLMLAIASFSPAVRSDEPAHADVAVQGESVCPDTAAAAAAKAA